MLRRTVAHPLDAARSAVVHGDQVVGAEEEIDVARGELVFARAEIDAVQDEIEIAVVALDLRVMRVVQRILDRRAGESRTCLRAPPAPPPDRPARRPPTTSRPTRPRASADRPVRRRRLAVLVEPVDSYHVAFRRQTNGRTWGDPISPPLSVEQRRLRSRQPRDRHAVRRATHVVEADLLEELNRRGIAAVFAADAELDVRPVWRPFVDGHLHELAHAGLIDRGERVLLHDLELRVVPAGTSPSRRATSRAPSA